MGGISRSRKGLSQWRTMAVNFGSFRISFAFAALFAVEAKSKRPKASPKTHKVVSEQRNIVSTLRPYFNNTVVVNPKPGLEGPISICRILTKSGRQLKDISPQSHNILNHEFNAQFSSPSIQDLYEKCPKPPSENSQTIKVHFYEGCYERSCLLHRQLPGWGGKHLIYRPCPGIIWRDLHVYLSAAPH